MNIAYILTLLTYFYLLKLYNRNHIYPMGTTHRMCILESNCMAVVEGERTGTIVYGVKAILYLAIICI